MSELEKIILMIRQYKETALENPGNLTRQEITGLHIFLQKVLDRLERCTATEQESPQ